MPTNSSLDLQRFYPAELEIVSIEEDSDEIRLHMRSRSKSFCCPKCGEELRKLHATHHRTVQDLPILGKRVFLVYGKPISYLYPIFQRCALL